jgi:hypothetical protein
MDKTILTGHISPKNKEKSEKTKDVVKERLRLIDHQISQRIDQEESKKEEEEKKKAAAEEKKAAQDKKNLSFADFCKALEYRRTAVYYRGTHLFDKFNPKINSQNERIFYDYLSENSLLLTYGNKSIIQ